MKLHQDPDQVDFVELTARVYRLCYGLVDSDGQARDAAQEALTRAWSQRSRRREGVSWWTWSAGFAIRVCREFKRSRSETAPLEPDFIEASGDVGRESEYGREYPSALSSAIAGLPDRQREVVVMRFLMGQSTSEVAQTLDCPIGTVKSNLFKAVRSLRGRLELKEQADEV